MGPSKRVLKLRPGPIAGTPPADPAHPPGRRRLESAASPSSTRRWEPIAWLIGVVVLAAALAAERLFDLPNLPDRVPVALSGALLAMVAVGLTVRCGGRPLVPGLVFLAFAAVGAATLWPVLLAGEAVATAVLAGCLAVMGTKPASRFRHVVQEVVLACVLATVCGLAVAGFGQALQLGRFDYVVLGAALIGEFLLVYRLGAGLHGVGRRGVVVVVGALVLLAVVLAYTQALGRWGSPELIDHIDQVRHFLRVHLRAVPHPVETLLGVPALAWGVFMRARRRQGWWVCAFGAATTAPAATRFVEYGVPTLTTALGAAYSLVLGLALGYLVIRIDQALSGGRGRRARRNEEATAHRPEPGRLAPLQ